MLSPLAKKRIIYVCGHNQRTDFMVALSRRLEEKFGTESFFLNGIPGDNIVLKNLGVSQQKILKITPFSPIKGTVDIEYLKTVEKKYRFNIWSSWQISAPRKKSRERRGEQEILPWVEIACHEFEDVFKRIKPDFLLTLGITSSIGAELLHRIAHGHDCEHLQITNARIKNRITIDNGLKDHWPLLVRRYEEIKQRGLTEQEERAAADFIDHFITKRPKPSSPKENISSTMSQKVKWLYTGIKRVVRHKSLPNVGETFIWPITDKLLEKSSLFENPVPEEKFVFFPLHYQPEASTSLWGKWYVNQPTLIENIAKSLPVGYKLYVKEHTHGASGRPKGFFKSIKKLPNVRLIRPTANTFQLIKECSLITTITGTVGWEGIIFRKPTLTFGDIFYNLFDQTVHVTDISKLPELIKMNLNTALDEKKVKEFVAAMLQSSFEGSAVCPGECKGRTMEEENLTKIVHCLTQYAAEICGNATDNKADNTTDNTASVNQRRKE